ncbi:hypothetical protein OXPF_02660 [Oxobacter pfennigii]|uniref:Winged helix-turn helix domain-containing protein n=1 Tax=Oxobacter pfennigii TaxID=36849 RepID=A0A0P8WDR3_9CLOT|nr:helix-turn-helix domain-containing protein [Oxobacter pfennigii]KPU46156.1 hypothetical protein OXPF_02660 [Oxobacter pfennigii]
MYRLPLFALIYNTDDEIDLIREKLHQDKSKRMRIRYLVILSHLHGHQNIDIAITLGLCPHTVGTYIRKYKRGGLENLVPAPIPGAPRMLTKDQERQIIELLTTKTPKEAGFPHKKNWNSLLVMEWIKNNFGIKYSHSGMVYALGRLSIKFSKSKSLCTDSGIFIKQSEKIAN